MVLLILVNKCIDELIYETTINEYINNCTINITILYNNYIILNTLVYNIQQLIQSIDNNNNNTIIQQLQSIINDIQGYISIENVKQRIPLQLYKLKEYIDNLNDLLKQLSDDIINKYDIIKQYISDNNNIQPLIDQYNLHIEQTSNNVDNIRQYKLYDVDKSIIWFSNKSWQRSSNNKISLYVGNNNKSIIKIQLSHNSSNQPTTSNQIDNDTKKAIYTYYAKQQKEQEEIDKSISISTDYNLPWNDTNALKNQMHGLSNINYR